MIEIDNVSFSYTKEKNTLEDINLTIPQGELILLCGESGCGKTTITKLINGLIPHFTAGEQLTGTVRVDGTTVSDTKMYELAKVVGSVFQNPKSQFFNLDSDSEISFGLENEGLPPQEIQMRVTQAVQDLNNSHLEHRNIFSMSGGEKQSLAFASVYAMQPSIFVLDEPSANLDAPAIETLRRQIKQVKKNGHTIVIAEHRLYFLADLADRIVYLKNGKIEQIWKPEEFLSLSKDIQISLGLRSVEIPTLNLPKSLFSPQKADLLVKNLSYSYKKNPVLKHVDFSASYGDIIGIVGRNGVGKSTLCQCLCGLLKKKSGTISFRGKQLSLKECRKLCAFVMQDVNHQLFSDSVWDECELSAPSESAAMIETLLKRFDLLGLKDSHPMALSGGQKQRLAVATAILSRKKILIFDEPTSGLDYRHMMEVSSLLKELGKEEHIILVVSHDIEFINATCTNIFSLQP